MNLSRRLPLNLRGMVLLALACACGPEGSGMSVTINRQGCTASCPSGQLLSLFAYRVPSMIAPCVIASTTVSLTEGEGHLQDLPLEEGETIFLAATTSCADRALCISCWDTRQVRATKGAVHQLSLKTSTDCNAGDVSLTLVKKLPQACP